MDIDKVLARVAKLLDRAEHPGTPPEEADASRSLANKLMLDYAIEEAMLDRSQPEAKRQIPETATFNICRADSHLKDQLVSLADSIINHFRCRAVYGGLEYKYGDCYAKVLGYPSDLKFVQFMFAQLHLHLSGELEPKPDIAKSFDENVFILHEAGAKWKRIADLMNGASITRSQPGARPERTPGTEQWWKAVRPSKQQPDYLVPWPDGHRLITAYKRWCKEVGAEPRAIQSPVSYQRNVAAGYADRIGTRLWRMRLEDESRTAGTALALRDDAVKEEYNRLYGDVRSHKSKVRTRYDSEARSRGGDAADRADLSGNKVSNEGGRRELG